MLIIKDAKDMDIEVHSMVADNTAFLFQGVNRNVNIKVHNCVFRGDYLIRSEGGSLYDSVIDVRMLNKGGLLKWVEEGVSFVQNTVSVGYIYGGDEPTIVIFNTQKGAYNTGNKFNVKVAERCENGIVHVAGMARSSIHVTAYDNDQVKDDLVWAGSIDGGNRCLGLTITVHRQKGVMDGVFDVNLEDATGCILLDCQGLHSNNHCQVKGGKGSIILGSTYQTRE